MSNEESANEDLGGHRQPPSLLSSEETSRSINLSDILQIGSNIEFIRTPGSNQKSQQPTASEVTRHLEQIQNILSSREFTSVVPEQIEKFISRIKGEYDHDETLRSDDCTELQQKATTWLHLLNRELKEEERVPASDTGMLDVDRLANSPERLVQPAVWEWLEDKPKSDIQEACKTLIIGCSTASVMLSLRAVEHCLRKWYEHEEGDEELDLAWGHVLDQLMEEYAEEDKKNDTVLTQLSDLPPVLSNLYYLKEKRNEVNHPDKSPSPQEARRTLMIVASTLTEIHSVIREQAGQEALSKMSEQDSKQLHGTETQDIGKEDLLKAAIVETYNNSDYENGVPRSKVYDLADEMGIKEEEVNDILQYLLMRGHMYEPDEEHLRPI